MQLKFKKKFLKQLSELPSQVRSEIEEFVFVKMPVCHSLADAGNIEKMRGFDSYYKVRFGSYRVGLKLESDGTLVVQMVMHRKEIYRYFP
jgi:mRNA interferase RelE/StbE